jgi:hypothetical protein
MTLLDAPVFDEVRDRRRRVALYSAAAVLLALIVGCWLAAGRPVDWPWNWNSHLQGRITVNRFLKAVEKNDLPTAYGIWIHDKNWQQHPLTASGAYTFARFQGDWSSSSPDNEYGVIQSHKIVRARIYGNVLMTESLINGRKSKGLYLDYDPKTHTLTFSPEGVEFYQGP